jgi:protein-disulfide isomerase
VNERLLGLFQPYTALLIVPIFALANAGVSLDGATLTNAFTSPLTWGVIAGLVLGKLVGITGATALLARLRPGSLPPGLPNSRIAGGAALSGIGFTISLFIVDLALPDPTLADEARVGVLAASVIATLLGAMIFVVQKGMGTEDGADFDVLLRPVDPERDHIRGPVDAPLTLIEYGDFECPFCSRATGAIIEVRAHFGDQLRYVFRHLPLTTVHPHALEAARASEAAAGQGKFWEMHDLLFQHSDALGAEEILGYAEELGLDLDRFEDDLRTGDYVTRVEDDAFDAESNEIDGTPTFFLGQRRHRGPHDAATLIRELSRLLDE